MADDYETYGAYDETQHNKLTISSSKCGVCNKVGFFDDQNKFSKCTDCSRSVCNTCRTKESVCADCLRGPRHSEDPYARPCTKCGYKRNMLGSIYNLTSNSASFYCRPCNLHYSVQLWDDGAAYMSRQ